MDPKTDQKPAAKQPFPEPNIPAKFLKPYNPTETEPKVYEKWLADGYFNPDTSIAKGMTKADAPVFSIIQPPPNVTGTLHMGHALATTLEDIMTRYHRMLGHRTLWLPGTDHAAIATQSKVEGIIYKAEGKRRQDIGRDELLKRIDAFAKESHDTIVSQVKKLGASIDWSREAFTLDEKRNLAVKTAFKQMYDDGLIYRGYRVVNWDPKGQTTISDDEIIYTANKAKLYTFKYSKDFPIAIATTRPETKVGDVAVAVYPGYYKEFVDKKEYDIDFAGEKIHIKIVEDTAADPEFGTGAVGVTPAHSQIDYEIAQRHGLPLKPVIDEFARMSVKSPLLAGKKVIEAREIVVQWLKDEGLLEKEEEVDQNIATAERTGGVIEPLPKLQWFIDVNKRIKVKNSQIEEIKNDKDYSLKEMMRLAAGKGITAKIQFSPDRFQQIYHYWIDGLRDWCISRQIWYGHRIPAYFDIFDPKNKGGVLKLQKGLRMTQDYFNKLCTETDRSYVITYPHEESTKELELSSCSFDQARLLIEWKLFDKKELFEKIKDYDISKCEKPLVIDPRIDQIPENCVQDPDTLDTWFSSGLWTFSTLGWPEKTSDLATYHPTTVMETGYDIIFFWVARMILMSTYLLGEVPFKTVYLHGLMRNADGSKMSKSKGAIDPLEMSAKYGTDALRMSVIVGIGPGSDTKMSEDKIRAYKNFANKLWNITRFVLSSTEGETVEKGFSAWSADDAKIVAEWKKLLAEMTKEMDEFKFYLVAEKLYAYAWHEFADIILEQSKAVLGKDAASSDADKKSRKQLLLHLLADILKALHPFVPFVTEEIWSDMPVADKKPLIVESWPI